MFIYHCLFALVLKSPDGEWPITYTYTAQSGGYEVQGSDHMHARQAASGIHSVEIT